MAERYDVVVAGAGSAGATAAYFLARGGLKVALLDMKPREGVGDKVCGDAIDVRHFDRVGIPHPRGPEVEGKFHGVKVFAPNERDAVIVEGEGYALNRYHFGQRLLSMAEQAGAEFFGEHHAFEPLVEGSDVVGVKVRDLRGKRVFEIRSSVVIDATGATATLRNKLPEGWWISYRVPKEDLIAAYRGEIEVKEVPERERGYAVIYLNVEIAPGGYWWSFHKGGNSINLGLGVQTIPGNPNPRRVYEEVLEPRYKVSRRLHVGGGVVPTRRTVPCMAWNGFLAIGDAICAANPIHGGGIGPSMLGAKAASEAILEASERGDFSMAGLWGYHKRYHELYGAKQAGLDVLRLYLQRLTNDDFDFIISSGVVSGRDIYDIGTKGRLASDIVRRVSSGLKLLRRLSVLRKLVKVKEYMDRAIELYSKFPDSPEGFERWYAEERAFFNEVQGWMKGI